jgi:hypothetical protein
VGTCHCPLNQGRHGTLPLGSQLTGLPRASRVLPDMSCALIVLLAPPPRPSADDGTTCSSSPLAASSSNWLAREAALAASAYELAVPLHTVDGSRPTIIRCWTAPRPYAAWGYSGRRKSGRYLQLPCSSESLQRGLRATKVHDWTKHQNCQPRTTKIQERSKHAHRLTHRMPGSYATTRTRGNSKQSRRVARGVMRVE